MTRSLEDARKARIDAPKTKEQLISEGKVKNFKTEVFEDSSFGNKEYEYANFNGCKFVNHDFTKSKFIECDFRWATFTNCKGIELTQAPKSDIALDKLICSSPNFINCNFTEATFINEEKDSKKKKNEASL